MGIQKARLLESDPEKQHPGWWVGAEKLFELNVFVSRGLRLENKTKKVSFGQKCLALNFLAIVVYRRSGLLLLSQKYVVLFRRALQRTRVSGSL